MERLEAALAGVTHRAELYEGARHGFTMADLKVYDEAADERHWRELLGLLGRTIGAERSAPGPGSSSPRPPG